ncbi:uncharacterized protein JCM6883_004741 [Sporobolomyces salmoneus]|uniref:uncharacterized protein n=1 Tax=Sporobolomyces salmoneus TaxID=183962 RepID=UPI003170F226
MSPRDPLLIYAQRHASQPLPTSGRRRLSIRPPHPSSSISGSSSVLRPLFLRLRGRRSKLLLLGILVGVGVLGMVVVGRFQEGGLEREGRVFLKEGGFGKDWMGREEEDPETTTIEETISGRRRKKLRLDGNENGEEEEGERERLCLLFPWREGCEGVEGKRDPFRWWEYVKSRGRLFFPGQLKPRNEGSRESKSDQAQSQQPHPIHLLISQARSEWASKLSRQSKTLAQGIEEYERRYQRRPPKGFDEWYYHALANDFIMRDEFDLVDQFVTPFLALSPEEVRRRHEMLQDDEEFWLQDKTFTIELKDRGTNNLIRGPMNSTNPRPKQMLKLLEKISHNLPNMIITFTGHDQPWIVLSGESRERHIAAARAGKVLSPEEVSDPHDDPTLDGWANACPPSSPLRSLDRVDDRLQQKRIWHESDERGDYGLIVNHTETMNLCLNPENQLIHGFTSWVGPRPGTLYPIFSHTTTHLHSDFLVPPIDQYDHRLGSDPDWDEKRFDKVVWRGSTTGADLNIEHSRRWSQRVRLCRLPFEPGSKTLPYSPSDSSISSNEELDSIGPLSTFTANTKSLAQQYFDFAFVGNGVTQCDQDPKLCKEFSKQFKWDSEGWMEPELQNEYKYVIDVDGNGWSGRFHRLMSSKSLVLKSTIFPEWYSDMIQPWFHYVPVSTDYKDLWTIMAFFKGDQRGRGHHDGLAKEIGLNGKKWAEKHWRWVDMEVWFWRVLLEYARIMGRDENDLHSMDL